MRKQDQIAAVLRIIELLEQHYALCLIADWRSIFLQVLVHDQLNLVVLPRPDPLLEQVDSNESILLRQELREGGPSRANRAASDSEDHSN